MPGTDLICLEPPRTQSQMRSWAFAKRVCETVDVARAYRDVYDPGEEIEHKHYIAGAKLLKDPKVAEIIQAISRPALVELGVDKAHALKRLLETIDGDLTDYARTDGSFMTLDEIRQLPIEKRRLVKKYKETYTETGGLKSREIELEPKHPALALLAQIQQWVKPGNTTIITNETIVTYIGVAQRRAQLAADAARKAAEESKSAKHLARAAGVKGE